MAKLNLSKINIVPHNLLAVIRTSTGFCGEDGEELVLLSEGDNLDEICSEMATNNAESYGRYACGDDYDDDDGYNYWSEFEGSAELYNPLNHGYELDALKLLSEAGVIYISGFRALVDVDMLESYIDTTDIYSINDVVCSMLNRGKSLLWVNLPCTEQNKEALSGGHLDDMAFWLDGFSIGYHSGIKVTEVPKYKTINFFGHFLNNVPAWVDTIFLQPDRRIIGLEGGTAVLTDWGWSFLGHDKVVTLGWVENQDLVKAIWKYSLRESL